jgi:aldehyde:ferredoxin oxidoreductase
MMALMMQELPHLAIPLIDFTLYRDLWSAVTGIRVSKREYLEAGDRITVLERYMNTREGIRSVDDTLPERLLKEGRKSDPAGHAVPLEEMLASYYTKRGYNQDGVPTRETLKKLGIHESGG